ncbi:MAG: cytochrome c [Bacteroidota bacterium]
MDLRYSVNLLTTAILAILLLLIITLGYAFSTNTPTSSADTISEAATPPSAVDDKYIAGKKIWNANGCGACHNKSMTVNATGPALAGVTERWADYPRTDLYAWIRNNAKLTATGHPRAVEVTASFPGVMAPYPSLTDEELEALLNYIEGVSP